MSAKGVLFAATVHQALTDQGVDLIAFERAGGYRHGIHVYTGTGDRCTVAVRGPNARILGDAVEAALGKAGYGRERVAGHMVRVYAAAAVPAPRRGTSIITTGQP